MRKLFNKKYRNPGHIGKKTNQINQNVPRLSFGQIWTTKREFDIPMTKDRIQKASVPEAHYVIVLSNTEGSPSPEYPTLQVIPLSFNYRYASEYDLHIEKELNPAHFDCIAESWNIITLLERNLDEYIGKITDQTILKGLKLLWAQAFGLEVDLEELNKIPIGSSFMTYEIAAEEFRKNEFERSEYLRIPFVNLLNLLESELEVVEDQLQPNQSFLDSIGKEISKLPSPVEFIQDFIRRAALIGTHIATKTDDKIYSFDSNNIDFDKLKIGVTSEKIFDKMQEWGLTGTIDIIGNLFLIKISGSNFSKVTSLYIVCTEVRNGHQIYTYHEQKINKVTSYIYIDVDNEILNRIHKSNSYLVVKLGDDSSYIVNFTLKIPHESI